MSAHPKAKEPSSERRLKVGVDTEAVNAAHRQLMDWSDEADVSKELMKLFSAIHMLANEANGATRYAMRRGGEEVGTDDTFEEVEMYRDAALSALHNIHHASSEASQLLFGLATDPLKRAKIAALFLGDADGEVQP